jgi:hypothetical protein
MGFEPFTILDLKNFAHCISDWNSCQQVFKLAASFNLDKDLMPKPPSRKGEQTLCHATVTNFLLVTSPLQRKFLIHFSMSLIKLEGHE